LCLTQQAEIHQPGCWAFTDLAPRIKDQFGSELLYLTQ
jgi:hypothetical protein